MPPSLVPVRTWGDIFLSWLTSSMATLLLAACLDLPLFFRFQYLMSFVGARLPAQYGWILSSPPIIIAFRGRLLTKVMAAPSNLFGRVQRFNATKKHTRRIIDWMRFHSRQMRHFPSTRVKRWAHAKGFVCWYRCRATRHFVTTPKRGLRWLVMRNLQLKAYATMNKTMWQSMLADWTLLDTRRPDIGTTKGCSDRIIVHCPFSFLNNSRYCPTRSTIISSKVLNLIPSTSFALLGSNLIIASGVEPSFGIRPSFTASEKCFCTYSLMLLNCYIELALG